MDSCLNERQSCVFSTFISIFSSCRNPETLQIVPSIDRLSGLPDDILYHIVSFPPTKLSAATSILAKRWRYLWAYVPTFRISDFDGCGEYQFETCINIVIVRNVKNIYLGFVSQVKLPRCIFTCKTLVDLSLCLCGDIPMSGVVCLPALKKLYLHMVKYESDKSLEHLLSGCPVLEDLTVERFEMDLLVCSYISSPTLKRLLNSSFVNDSTYTNGYTVKIDTLALRYLQLHDSISSYLSYGLLTSLIEADVELQNFGDVLYPPSVFEFVGRLYKVKHLSTRRMEVPNSAFSTLTVKFPNLSELELDAHWRFFPKFLEYSDNLEGLIIRGSIQWALSDDDEHYRRSEVFSLFTQRWSGKCPVCCGESMSAPCAGCFPLLAPPVLLAFRNFTAAQMSSRPLASSSSMLALWPERLIRPAPSPLGKLARCGRVGVHLNEPTTSVS
ncbi:hypothetical protein DH2020_013457 [Rehmannia glutinosa]|uniref:F-box/LRR-repeat protein 15/At3g58940/PEG3-like LRR domain-containing protein n=1 Tax=Rehmannia glutinosa TaxID=99300 RepID=A0ABR0X2B9_REHGL